MVTTNVVDHAGDQELHQGERKMVAEVQVEKETVKDTLCDTYDMAHL
jgi:hypothetical protein